jgi:glucosamine--fructose-6-phosphate aminotransferase (isomerizing)
MAKPGKHTLSEIISQPQSWAKTVELVVKMQEQIKTLWQKPWQQVIWTGCGSPYYLSLSAATLLQQLTGRFSKGAPASELWLNPQNHYPAQGETLLVAVSRSGATTEVLNAARAFREERRGQVITITCEKECPLPDLGDLNIRLPWASEKSVAQTRSFASMYVAATALAAVCAGRDDLLSAMGKLPSLGEKLIQGYAPLASDLGRNLGFRRFYFLGGGMRYGLASELSLKMKEMTLSHSEPFHFMEFRHGPKSMVNKRTLIIGLGSQAQAMQEAAVIREMRELGAQAIVLSEEKAEADHAVAFASGLPEEVRGVLYLPVLHLMAYERALTKDLNPDSPTNLDAVVKLS